MKKKLFVLVLITYSLSYSQIVNIPDVNFKNALLSASASNHIAKDVNDNWMTIDSNNDGEIQISEAISIYSLSLKWWRIQDLTGVVSMANLTYLNCESNRLSSLDLSSNTALSYLDCSNNVIINLNINAITGLTYLNCQQNFTLGNLNLSTNIALEELYCAHTNISNLDLSNNTVLKSLNCGNNRIDTLDLSSNTILEILICDSNNLTTLDVSANVTLTSLSCSYNNLDNLNLDTNILLTTIKCSENNLSTLNLSTNTALALLHINGNNVSTIDTNVNTALINLSCRSNNINHLDLSANTELEYLDCANNNLNTLDVSNNQNLFSLKFDSNNINVIDLSSNAALLTLECSTNGISNLDLSATVNLRELDCSSNNISVLDLNDSLQNLKCQNNNLTSLDLSTQNLWSLKCSGNLNLNYINLKNGNNHNFSVNRIWSGFRNLPNLALVCVDTLVSDMTTFINSEVGHEVVYTEYCSLTPAQSNQINGNVKLDVNNNGCDINDLPIPNLMVMSSNGTENFATFTQENGDYLLYTNEGDFTTTVSANIPNYFTNNPISEINTFIGFNHTFTADFCIEPNQTVNDVNISIIPISQARPGFNTTYRIIYKNVGTTQQSGNIVFEYDNTKLSFLNANPTETTQTGNTITFNYDNLNLFETRTIDLEFNVHTPPIVNINDVLHFIATINPVAVDNTISDNLYILHQTIIGSYDPNDIICLEGNEIQFVDIDKYLHYVIRFQNKGTASAINIVVKNVLDNKLDWTTLQIESSSHTNRVAIKNGNKIEFIFENINLPDETTDEPNSHGFIAYKIKPNTNVVSGNIFLNQAKIFFDYNTAIDTNITTTRIIDNLVSVNDTKLLEAILLYPNPTKERINIKAKEAIIVNIEIYSKLGQLILSKSNANIEQIDISKLTTGMYAIKLVDNKGNSIIRKFIKY